jgi:DNA-binding winged helix-turn-helix (wHTH) protein/TolB-like protein/tetratricopeptide (TPR) repeat protein
MDLQGVMAACYGVGHSPAAMTTQPPIRFGTFELDPSSGELRRNGRRVPLQGQPAQVLCQLVSSPGQVVTRDDLRRAIWTDDTFVEFDTALNVAVNKVRLALQDSAATPRFIETVPKRGYRFLADVHPLEPAAASVDSAAPVGPISVRRPRFLRAALAVAALLAVLALGWSWKVGPRVPPPARARSVAVLPFKPLVAHPGDEALQAGMAEAVIIRLATLEHVRIPSLSTVQRSVASDPDPLAAGRALGVDAVLDGTLLRVNGSLRVSARLLEVETGAALWARQWDLPWTDVFAVQDAMASHVADALALKLAPEQQASLRRRPTSVAAYERYMLGRHLLARQTTADSRRAAEVLAEAVAIDPTSSAAHASLAFAYISIPLSDGPVKPYVELGREAARRALELDPRLAEAHAVLGRISFSFDWDVQGAELKMRRALELTPNDPFTLHCFSLMLAQEGRFDEALGLNDRLMAQDPVSTLTNRDRAVILFVARRYEESIAQARKTLEIDNRFTQAYWPLWRSYEQMGRVQEAVDSYLLSSSFWISEQELAALRRASRTGGMRGIRKQRLEDFLARPDPPAYSVAVSYAMLGDNDRALAWLEKCYEQRVAAMRTLKLNPEWDGLRADPRFKDLMRRAGIAEVTLAAAASS